MLNSTSSKYECSVTEEMSDKDFIQIVTKATVPFCQRFGLLITSTDGSDPIQRIQFENNNIAIRLLYGPPEFHVELSIGNKTAQPTNRLSLGELYTHASVREWMQENMPKGSEGERIPIEVAWYFHFLTQFSTCIFKENRDFIKQKNDTVKKGWRGTRITAAVFSGKALCEPLTPVM